MKPFLCLLLGVAVLLAAVPAFAGGHTTLQINQVDNCPTAVVAQPVYEAQRLRIEVGPSYTERVVQRIETPVIVEQVQTVPVERIQVVERVVAPQKLYVTATPQRVLQLNTHSHQQVLQLNSHHQQQAIVLQSRQRSPVLQLNVDNHHHGNDSLAVRQRDGILGSRTIVRNRR